MRKLAIIVAALAVPVTARAADGAFDLAGSVVQMLASLALVVGMILVIYHFAGRLMKAPQSSAERYIRVLETRHLSPKKSLMLVEVGGEYLLLSNSGDGVTFLSKLELLEEIEVVEEKTRPAAALIPARLKERLGALLQELPLAAIKKNGGLA